MSFWWNESKGEEIDKKSKETDTEHSMLQHEAIGVAAWRVLPRKMIEVRRPSVAA